MDLFNYDEYLRPYSITSYKITTNTVIGYYHHCPAVWLRETNDFVCTAVSGSTCTNHDARPHDPDHTPARPLDPYFPWNRVGICDSDNVPMFFWINNKPSGDPLFYTLLDNGCQVAPVRVACLTIDRRVFLPLASTNTP